jgi:hypothetical protein
LPRNSAYGFMNNRRLKTQTSESHNIDEPDRLNTSNSPTTNKRFVAGCRNRSSIHSAKPQKHQVRVKSMPFKNLDKKQHNTLN